MRILGIIPARYASTRLPGKPLVDIGGKSMIQRVVEQTQRSKSLSEVVVATDDPRILDHVTLFGAEAVMTNADHASGTDRCFEALSIIGRENFDAVVNVQGDEPFIEPDQIDELCVALLNAEGGIATLAQIVKEDQDLDDPGEVLITTDMNMNALYFSRAATPFIHNRSSDPRYKQFRFLKHVGLYGYRSEMLEKIVQLPPSPLEKIESLEQLRWLENGFKVKVGLTEHRSFCVDTEVDLEEARRRVM